MRHFEMVSSTAPASRREIEYFRLDAMVHECNNTSMLKHLLKVKTIKKKQQQ